jgi:hypothetical protein
VVSLGWLGRAACLVPEADELSGAGIAAGFTVAGGGGRGIGAVGQQLGAGINRTAHKDTAVLLAGALGLTGPAAELFVAAARGHVPAGQVLAAAEAAALRSAAVAGFPYRGLAVFGEQDAAWFFGREAATGQVLDRMSRHLAGAGLLVVSGASGAGKSSLLRAGVLPRIRQGGLAAAPGAASWPYLVLTPTRAPLDELALRVAVLAGTDASAVRRGLAADPDGFALPARQAALAWPLAPAGDPNGAVAERDQPPPQRRLLLVVDQFEELFTQCAEEGQRRAFITALHAAATAGHGPDPSPAALVVLGVRADFEARCAIYPQLASAVQDRYLVTPMTERQLRMAITEPAKRAGSTVDDDLTGLLLAEVRNGQPGTFGAGVLPLLSHALDQSWRSRTGQAVTLADYGRTGGIDGAVAASAQRAYDALTPARQAAARQVFLRLTVTSSDGVDSADRVTRAELTAGKSPAEASDVEAVLEAFAAERLLTLAADTVVAGFSLPRTGVCRTGALSASSRPGRPLCTRRSLSRPCRGRPDARRGRPGGRRQIQIRLARGPGQRNGSRARRRRRPARLPGPCPAAATTVDEQAVDRIRDGIQGRPHNRQAAERFPLLLGVEEHLEHHAPPVRMPCSVADPVGQRRLDEG